MAGSPVPSSEHVQARFRRQRTRDTAPEIALRRRLHSMGHRYRVDTAPLAALRRRADIVFTRARVAVFVDGCFWHGCPDCDLRPKANAAWWHEKLGRNRERDADTDYRLARAGWAVVRVWEHEDVESAAARVSEAVAASRDNRVR
jgi:DNA mismatch endonuclease (patch repair protein)